MDSVSWKDAFRFRLIGGITSRSEFFVVREIHEPGIKTVFPGSGGFYVVSPSYRTGRDYSVKLLDISLEETELYHFDGYLDFVSGKFYYGPDGEELYQEGKDVLNLQTGVFVKDYEEKIVCEINLPVMVCFSPGDLRILGRSYGFISRYQCSKTGPKYLVSTSKDFLLVDIDSKDIETCSWKHVCSNDHVHLYRDTVYTNSLWMDVLRIFYSRGWSFVSWKMRSVIFSGKYSILPDPDSGGIFFHNLDLKTFVFLDVATLKVYPVTSEGETETTPGFFKEAWFTTIKNKLYILIEKSSGGYVMISHRG